MRRDVRSLEMEEWTSVEADWLPPPTAMEGVMTADDGDDIDIARSRVGEREGKGWSN